MSSESQIFSDLPRVRRQSWENDSLQLQHFIDKLIKVEAIKYNKT